MILARERRHTPNTSLHPQLLATRSKCYSSRSQLRDGCAAASYQVRKGGLAVAAVPRNKKMCIIVLLNCRRSPFPFYLGFKDVPQFTLEIDANEIPLVMTQRHAQALISIKQSFEWQQVRTAQRRRLFRRYGPAAAHAAASEKEGCRHHWLPLNVSLAQICRSGFSRGDRHFGLVSCWSRMRTMRILLRQASQCPFLFFHFLSPSFSLSPPRQETTPAHFILLPGLPSLVSWRRPRDACQSGVPFSSVVALCA